MTVTETAKVIRKALKTSFPKARMFTQAWDTSIEIFYSGNLAEEAIQNVAQPLSTFPVRAINER